jgi:hypothetical protein
MTIEKLPMTAEEFYALRDDRTSRCTASRSYQEAKCTLWLTAEAATTFSGQIMFAVAANLLSRWCRKVDLVSPAVASTLPWDTGVSDLGAAVLAQMKGADPFGEFTLRPGASGADGLTLCIGPSVPSVVTGPVVLVNAAGWLASITPGEPMALPTGDDGNCLGAIAASCFGVAQVFKVAVQAPADRYPRLRYFDLSRLCWANLPETLGYPSDLDFGKVLMIGAGSVGSAAAYCARLAGLRGRLTILDRDKVKFENLNRSPVFNVGAVGSDKARVVGDFLAGSGISTAWEPLWWDEFLVQRGRKSFDFDAWLPLANERGVRRSIQHNLPPLMIHASTTANWGVNHGRHIPGRDDCLIDRFPHEVDAAQLACATGPVVVRDTSIDAALPFSSLFAGLLIAAELVKAQMPGYPQVPNFALFDWFRSFEDIQGWDRRPRPGCICMEQGREIHDLYNSRSKYRQSFKFAL